MASLSGAVVTDTPETRFAKLGRDRIAYQVVGEGPPDLLWVTIVGDALDARWEYPPLAAFLRRLASFSRLIMFDRRGVGGSDPVPVDALPGWEDWVDDALSVLDAVGSRNATILGVNEAGPTALLFAATRPERTQSLILFNTAARSVKDVDYPWGYETHADVEGIISFIEENRGTKVMAQVGQPGLAEDEAFCRWLAKSERMMCSGRQAAAYVRQMSAIDVRDICSIPAKWNSAVMTSGVSEYTSRLVFLSMRSPESFLSQRRSPFSSPVRASSSKTEASTS